LHSSPVPYPTAWLPKATVQAALAGLPYDAAVASFGPESPQAGHAEVLLALGVLAIAVTAPLGAVAVAVSGERLLTMATQNAEECEAGGAAAVGEGQMEIESESNGGCWRDGGLKIESESHGGCGRDGD